MEWKRRVAEKGTATEEGRGGGRSIVRHLEFNINGRMGEMGRE